MKARRRTQVVKGEVCKTSMRRFESARRLHTNGLSRFGYCLHLRLAFSGDSSDTPGTSEIFLYLDGFLRLGELEPQGLVVSAKPLDLLVLRAELRTPTALGC